LTRKGMFAANVCGAHLLMMPGDVNRGGYPLGVNYHYYMGASGFPYMSLCRNCFISTREAGAVPEPRTRLEPFWDGVWFRQQLSYDAKSARDNLLYIRSNGLKTERFVDITLSTSKPLAAYFGGFAWGGPTLCISVDWVAVRRYAPEEPKAIIED
ncbi:MAG: hypothetical protein NTX50_01445, partial [Candidatus Sumerlaeota bacterium]|nr:hypothetical protein [Candidatus Sumerlaeota bacterium]